MPAAIRGLGRADVCERAQLRCLSNVVGELRAGILSIYEKNPICITRDAMLTADGETEREREIEWRKIE